MKKFIACSFLAMGLAFVASEARASAPSRGAKPSVGVNYTATVSSISMTGAAVVYGVVMSTGATGDFVAFFDTNTVVGVAATMSTSTFKTRCMAGSTITTSTCFYDPPLQFNLGIAAVLSTAADAALVIFEKGRVVQGY